MRIIVAVPDRDLLQALSKLLELNGHEVSAVFDGVQAVSEAANTRFGLALLDDQISRVSIERLIGLFEEAGTRVLVLSKDSAAKKPDASGRAVLKYPFLPEELLQAIAPLENGGNSTEERHE